MNQGINTVIFRGDKEILEKIKNAVKSDKEHFDFTSILRLPIQVEPESDYEQKAIQANTLDSFLEYADNTDSLIWYTYLTIVACPLTPILTLGKNFPDVIIEFYYESDGDGNSYKWVTKGGEIIEQDYGAREKYENILKEIES